MTTKLPRTVEPVKRGPGRPRSKARAEATTTTAPADTAKSLADLPPEVRAEIAQTIMSIADGDITEEARAKFLEAAGLPVPLPTSEVVIGFKIKVAWDDINPTRSYKGERYIKPVRAQQITKEIKERLAGLEYVDTDSVDLTQGEVIVPGA